MLKLYEWVFEDENSQATLALAFITGKYQVEKPQLFYLRDELTGQFLDEGTAEELAERFGVTPKTIRWWATPTSHKRDKGNRKTAVRLD